MQRAQGGCTQVRRLMAVRQAPGWQFSTLFLVKDSLAAMLQAAGKEGSRPGPLQPSISCLLTHMACIHGLSGRVPHALIPIHELIYARTKQLQASAGVKGACPQHVRACAGMLEDALREYSELEACYLEALAAGGPLAAHPFGDPSYSL
jgi:hypothetical protein